MTTLVVGLGSEFGSDYIGWFTVELLKKTQNNNHNLKLFKSSGNGSDWMHEIGDAKQVIFIDAVRHQSKVGKIHCFENEILPENLSISSSTHQINVMESISLAKSLKYLRVPYIFYGIEVSNDLEDELSSELKIAAEDLCHLIRTRSVESC